MNPPMSVKNGGVRNIATVIVLPLLRLTNDPRSIGQALQGFKFGEFWKYRVGDWRIICKIEDERVTVLVLRIGHRSKAVYKPK